MSFTGFRQRITHVLTGVPMAIYRSFSVFKLSYGTTYLGQIECLLKRSKKPWTRQVLQYMSCSTYVPTFRLWFPSSWCPTGRVFSQDLCVVCSVYVRSFQPHGKICKCTWLAKARLFHFPRHVFLTFVPALQEELNVTRPHHCFYKASWVRLTTTLNWPNWLHKLSLGVELDWMEAFDSHLTVWSIVTDRSRHFFFTLFHIFVPSFLRSCSIFT